MEKTAKVKHQRRADIEPLFCKQIHTGSLIFSDFLESLISRPLIKGNEDSEYEVDVLLLGAEDMADVK